MSRRWLALHGLRRSPALFASTCLAIALSTFAASSAQQLSSQLGAHLETLVGLGHAVVYLHSDASMADAERIAAKARAFSVEVKIETPEDNAKVLVRMLGRRESERTHFSDLLGYTIELSSNQDPPRQAALEAISADVSVEAIDDGAALSDRVATVRDIIGWVRYSLLLFVLLGAAFVINITVSLSLVVRREELQIQRIVGADDVFVLLPLWVEAVVSGVCGGLLGIGCSAWLLGWVGDRLLPALERLGLGALSPFDSRAALGSLLLAVMLSLFGTTVAGLRQLWSLE